MPCPLSFRAARDADLLDRYADERRRIFLEVTGPTARENKRRMTEADPERKKADFERLQQLHNDTQFQRTALTMTYKLVGNPIDLFS